jgi:FdhD protein
MKEYFNQSNYRSFMEPFQNIQILHMSDHQKIKKNIPVTTEHPLKICIDHYLFEELMRTPGDEKALVTGLLHSHQIISAIDELKSFSLKYSEAADTTFISLNKPFSIYSTLNANARSVCCIEKKMSVSEVNECVNQLANCQPIRSKTRSTHAAIMFDQALNRLASKEDVGRHNALDKVIGQTILDQTLDKAFILVLSSRVSHELIMKIIHTPIQVIISVSRPTSLAVKIACRYGIHMACLSKEGGILIFSGMDYFVNI